ncbi:MAG: hypothetical protein GY710_05500 [Desulfobacteraceae bacterium]|nr:hypothetical protein [Desulfobacteraceae bacterium]
MSEKNNCEEEYDYTSEEVPDDKYAFDVSVKQSDGKTIDFRVLTFGEITSGD